jgi:hypothetical protein
LTSFVHLRSSAFICGFKKKTLIATNTHFLQILVKKRAFFFHPLDKTLILTDNI